MPEIQIISQPVEPWENPATDGTRKAVGVPLGVLPPGHSLQSLKPFLDAYRTRPERRIGVFYVAPRSFADYVLRFRHGDTSALFLNRRFLWWKLTCVFDWHPPSPDQHETGNCQFRAWTVTRNPEPIVARLGMSVFYGGLPR